MAKKKNEYDRNAALGAAREHLTTELGYTDIGPAIIADQECIVAMVDERPVIIAWSPEADGPITPADQEFAQELAASIDNGPADYIWATSTGAEGDGYIFSWLPDKECQVSELPAAEAAPGGEKGRKKHADAMGFKQLQTEFDQLHEQIYAAREPVDSSNDLTAQLCKCIFLKMHMERHPDFRVDADQPLLTEIFQANYIQKHGQQAVEQIKKAFVSARSLAEYNVVDDRGNSFEIFDQDDYIKFRRPDTYMSIARFLNRHLLTQPETSGIEDDMVGRAFDVMLRGKFEGKGGMGVYLTPQQVRDAMVQMVFNDVLTEDPGLLTRVDPKTGQPEIRVCDPCCGSAGFLITSMREVRKHVDKLVGMSAEQRAKLLQDIFHHGFEGADNASNMVLLARINMALHGDTHPRVFRVSNSLTTDIFRPESFDLILTNPPFKKGGVTEKSQAEVLHSFRSAIEDQGQLTHDGEALALGAKPDAKGRWKPVKSVDPAVLFIDRCLQLLKPGGRLLIVLPDGILCNSGDRYVREYLMGMKDETTGQFLGGKAVVKAVVSLPPVTFRLSGAGAKTSFLYVQKKRPGDEQGPVFMAVADSVGFDMKQNKEVLTGENDLVRIVEAYKDGPKVDGAEA
jgi:type I restriction enzyme M protein